MSHEIIFGYPRIDPLGVYYNTMNTLPTFTSNVNIDCFILHLQILKNLLLQLPHTSSRVRFRAIIQFRMHCKALDYINRNLWDKCEGIRIMIGIWRRRFKHRWVISFILFEVINMKVILADAGKKYRGKDVPQKAQLEMYVQTHRLFKPTMPQATLVATIHESLKKNHHSGSRGQPQPQQQQHQESLHQLSLYLNRDNNKQIFLLFEHILTHPSGVTYESLSKRLRTDIITVSHYCCKLKKLRLIDWQHQKEGVVVFPRSRKDRQKSPIKYSAFNNEVTFDIKDSFLFHELNLNENIWINISSEDSLSRGGLTNEEIKRKILKHAENKMVRRTVESMKYLDKNAERQGKVFEFKYKNQTAEIKAQMAKKNEDAQDIDGEIDILQASILAWLEERFPEFKGENFLLKLINNKFKDYLSILGVKQSKRQCTPLKLNRYIKVLNYLHRAGGMRESELRTLIVKDEEHFNVGIMHKRSLMGILEGLKGLGIIVEENSFYYPGWVKEEDWVKRQEPLRKFNDEDQIYQQPPKKKIHIDTEGKPPEKKSQKIKRPHLNGASRGTQQPHYNKISEHKYKFELFAAVLTVNLQKVVNRCFRKAFNRIIYVERKKNAQRYAPQLHVLTLLDRDQKVEVSFEPTLGQFYRELDFVIEQRGCLEGSLQVDNQLVKFLRKNPSRSSNFLRIKYGKNWSSKFLELSQANLIKTEEEGLEMLNSSRFLI